MKTRIAIAAIAAVLMATGLAYAQSTTTATTTATTTTAAHHTAHHHHTAAASSSSSTSSSSSSSSSSMASSDTGALSCHTKHAAGESCACTKAPTRHGTAQAGANGGHAMCMVPAAG